MEKTKNIALTDEQIALFLEAEKKASGFSNDEFFLPELKDRIAEESLPWNYKARLKEFLKSDTRLLDMGTGDGRFLLSLAHPFGLTKATVRSDRDYKICSDTLIRYGIDVKQIGEDNRLDFPDNSFDLVINHHDGYDLDEVNRVLKNGGHFITEQVGAKGMQSFTELFGNSVDKPYPLFNLENEVLNFKNHGFRIIYRNQFYPVIKFSDIGAVVHCLKTDSRRFSEFSVEKNRNELAILQKEINSKGCCEVEGHRFIIVAKKI